MRMEVRLWLMVVVVVVVGVLNHVEGQQSYVNNHQMDCYNSFNVTDGYECNGAATSCQSYLIFRAKAPSYNSPPTISYLLNSKPSLIAQANNVSDDHIFPTDALVLVPVNCSCSSSWYQHNASYVLKYSSETYFTVANETYQGLSTCQALMSQNNYSDRNLLIGFDLRIPLRCACPTTNQISSGFKFLLTYIIDWNDDVPTIAQRFGVDQQVVLDANRLSSSDIIFPFNTFLIPLKSPPSASQLQSFLSPPPAAPPLPPPPPPSGDSRTSKWVFVGVGIGAALLLLLLCLFFFFFCRNKAKQRKKPTSPPPSPPKLALPSKDGKSDEENVYSSSTPVKSWSNSISSEGVRNAVESMTVYKYSDLQLATQFFSESNRIRGSVYKAVFMGDFAAVKVMKGDVSGEINILKRINHSNIIRLSGFCVNSGNTYLVYEYAENGTVADWLTPTKCHQVSWKQRVQIAHDVADALNYLHNFTTPPYIHKNLDTSNILLDGGFRAKVSNFGLARTLDAEEGEDGDGGFQLTRHVVGTQGYLAPEYIENGVITPKLDVFAFGVVILELVSGREATPRSNKKSGGGEEVLLSDSINEVLQGDNVTDKLKAFIDPSLQNQYPLELAYSLAQLAKRCVNRDLNSRPTMSEVFITLSKILSSSLDWDPSDDLHSSSSLSHSFGR